MTGDLPLGWAWAEFGSIADTQLGKMLSAKSRHGHRLRPYLRNQNVQWHHFDLSDVAEMDYSEAESAKYELRPGDLLICEGGEVGRCAVWSRPYYEMHFQKALHRVRPLAGISVRWIEYFLRWSAETGRFGDHTSGSTISHLPQRDLRRLHVPVPPTAEQELIVAAIEEHFSRLDAAESALHQALERVEALRSSLLADAFHANSRPPFDWKLTTIGDVAAVQLGRQRSPQHHTGSQMRPYLRSANVTWQGISLGDVKQMNFDDTDFATYKLEPGDLLLNEASGSPSEVGKPAIWNGEIENCCFQNTLLRLRPHEIEVQYLYWYCYAAARSGRFGDAGRGVNIRHLGKQGLARFPVLISPVEQRGQIVSRLEGEFQQVAAIEQAARSALDRVTALRRAILAAAFSGQLVPQDPTDESATVLLERVEAAGSSREKMRKASV